MSKSCIGCPSFLTPAESQTFFMKNIGVPVCARFGKPIASIETTEKKRKEVAQAIAKTCDKHGEPRPSAPNWSEADFMVTFPDPDVLTFNRRAQQDNVRNCQTCEHFVREDVVLRDLGFGTGLCSAKGKLILPARATYAARDCTERSIALNGVRTNTDGLVMLPEYSADFTLSADPIKYHEQMKRRNVDPTEYASDLEVSPEDAAIGIRAWRRIEDPTTGNETHLPIFRREFFDEREQELIPATGDDEHPEDYVDFGFYVYKVAVLWRELDETPGAWGQAGVGKTEFGRHMAWLMQIPFVRVSITGSTELDDIAGKMRFENGETVWQDGRVTSAWSKPCVLVVDEPNTGQPDVFQFLRPMFDNSKQLVVDSNRGEHRDRNDHCYPIVCMNPAWDAKNVGTHEISDADANRLMHIMFSLPPERLEREILTTRCAHDDYQPSREILDTVMAIAADIRKLCEDDTLPVTWGIRPQLKVIRASRWFDLKTCYRMAIADFLEPQVQEEFMDVVNSHVE